MNNLFEDARKESRQDVAKLSDKQRAGFHIWFSLAGLIMLWFIPNLFQIDTWKVLLLNKEMLGEFNGIFIASFILIALSTISYEHGLQLGTFTLRTAYLIWGCSLVLMLSGHIDAGQLIILGFVVIFKRGWMLVSFILSIWWMIVFYTINQALTNDVGLAFICGVAEGFVASLIMNSLINIMTSKKRRCENKALREEL